MIEPLSRAEYSLQREAREVLYEVLTEKQRIIKQLSNQLVDFTSELSNVAAKCEKMQKVEENLEGNLLIEDLLLGGFVNSQDGISYILVDLSELIRQKSAKIKIDPKAKIIKQIGRDEEKMNREIEIAFNNIKIQYEKVSKQMIEKNNEYEDVIHSLKSLIKNKQEEYAGKISQLEEKIEILQDSNEMFEVQMEQLKKQKNDWGYQGNKREKDMTIESAQSPHLLQAQQLQKRVALLQKQILLMNTQNHDLSAANASLQKTIQFLREQRERLQKQCKTLQKQIENIRRVSFEEQSKVMQFFPGNKFISQEKGINDDKQGNNLEEEQQCRLQKLKIENNQLLNENQRLKKQRKNQNKKSQQVQISQNNQQLSQTALFMADLVQKIKNLSSKNELVLRKNEPESSEISFDLSKSISISLVPKITLRDPQQFHLSLHTSPLPQKDTSFPSANTHSKTAEKQQLKQKQKQKVRPKKFIRLGY